MQSASMGLVHRMPFEDKRCIVSRYQTCRFSENPLKNMKSVFIAAPTSLMKLTDVVKGIVKEYKYDPVMAIDLTEYNNSAFCAQICRPMLEALVVIVIGDWKKNQGNVNVAFEHGIATSMGCEIVPVWVSSDEKDPFDISGLSAILIKKDWETNTESLGEFTSKFREYFEGKSSAQIMKSDEPRISDEERAQILELVQRFNTILDQDERKAIVSMLLKLVNVSSNACYDEVLVKWITLTTVIFAQSFEPQLSAGIGRRKFEPDFKFLELLKRTVDWNCRRLHSDVATNSDFHKSLSAICVRNGLPMTTRRCALECIVALGNEIGGDELLWVVATLARDTKIEESDYNSLKLGQSLQSYIERALTRGPSLTPVLEMINGLRRSSDSVVKKRGDELLIAVTG